MLDTRGGGAQASENPQGRVAASKAPAVERAASCRAERVGVLSRKLYRT